MQLRSVQCGCGNNMKVTESCVRDINRAVHESKATQKKAKHWVFLAEGLSASTRAYRHCGALERPKTCYCPGSNTKPIK